MELRTILYGYGKDHLRFYAIPGEADVVRQIFREYISGKTMKQIADGLSREKVAYYKDKCSWTKNAVCRIIENERYTGDAEYPAIVPGEVYKTANTIKNGRGGKRETDLPEVALLKRRMYCAECGHRYTRRRNYSGTRERWECPAYCKTGFLLDDKALYSLIKANLAYAVSGSEKSFDAFSIEQCISQKQTAVSDMIKLSMKSGTNTEKYEAEIARLYSEIAVLRQQLKQAQQSMQDSIKTDAQIARAIKWLDENRTVFEEYDDVTVRRLVDTIRVNNDDTITVYLKGGIEITEPLKES